jgi:hypothetical protein
MTCMVWIQQRGHSKTDHKASRPFLTHDITTACYQSKKFVSAPLEGLLSQDQLVYGKLTGTAVPNALFLSADWRGFPGTMGPGAIVGDERRRSSTHDVRHPQAHVPLHDPRSTLELQGVRFQNTHEGTPKLMDPPAQAQFLWLSFVKLATAGVE